MATSGEENWERRLKRSHSNDMMSHFTATADGGKAGLTSEKLALLARLNLIGGSSPSQNPVKDQPNSAGEVSDFKSLKLNNMSTPKLFKVHEQEPAHQNGNLESKGTMQRACSYCFDNPDTVIKLPCSHLVCRECVGRPVPEKPPQCPICMNDSIDVSALYDLSYANENCHPVELQFDGDTPKIVKLRERQLAPTQITTALNVPRGVQAKPSNTGTLSDSKFIEKGIPVQCGFPRPHSANSGSSNKTPPSGSLSSSSLSSSGGSCTTSTCTSCDEGVPAFAACEDCKELMCTSCTSAHQRLKVTKDHSLTIVKSPPSMLHVQKPKQLQHQLQQSHEDYQKEQQKFHQQPNVWNSARGEVCLSLGNNVSAPVQTPTEGGKVSSAVGSGMQTTINNNTISLADECSIHRLPFTQVCRECRKRCCVKCDTLIEHKMHNFYDIETLIDTVHSAKTKAEDMRPHIEEAMKMVEGVEREWEERLMHTQSEIEAFVNEMHKLLHDRANTYKLKVETVKERALSGLRVKHEALRDSLSLCALLLREAANVDMRELVKRDVTQFLDNCVKLTEIRDRVANCTQIDCQPFMIPKLQTVNLVAIFPNSNVFSMLEKGVAEVRSNTYSEGCVATGKGVTFTIVGKATEFTVHSVDYFGERRYEGGDSVKCYFTPLENKVQLRKTQIQVHDNKDGSYTLRYVIDTEGSYKLHVIVNNFKIKNSPFLLRAIKGRTYADIQGKSPYLIFGGEGQEDGQLCRPWGICCDNDGFIYVADRSNNRVQVFDQAGNFKFKFGREGTKMGEFQRPASLAVDNKMKRLIVADKDNHRLQVFNLDGTWMSVIGEKGSQKGQFTYPWDVAVNSKSQILVSDTRNHRVQLLNHNGIFIYEYCLKEKVHDWQNHFDSPRGVCFTSDDWPIMNDFNKHRVLLIDKDFGFARHFSNEGECLGDLKRPQGICVDQQNFVLVSDSRNHRVQVFTLLGEFIATFGGEYNGQSPQMDRPAGICVTPSGNVLVVDFGNHRVLCY
ncbi:uncharacterized protein LOC142355641 isoform X2 [Convolutriloba macropyga]|uniref:uncharacterized protein LOC142355641 isoform X2 n=1 Tax=Convolutriloba macropyga TaxID=536237 RepID=UPI003F527B78